MEIYGKILNVAMPVFLLLVLLEKAYGWYKAKTSFNTLDTIASMSSGYTNTLKDVLGLGVGIISYEYMLAHWAFSKIEDRVSVYIVTFVVMDLAGYVSHLISHKVNFFWNQHVVHHSSEEFNLACALRQSISNIVSFFTVFLFPAALCGIPTNVIATVAPIHLFAQFWYHTVYIGKMGWLEHVIVTPSHHRVHHAINVEYMDKNIGQIFIFWDKIFGTFQAELPHVPPVYGISRPARTWNPFKINFQHLWLLCQDAYRAQRWEDKLLIWFKPTGWRPADVAAQYPVYKVADPYAFQKYTSDTTLVFRAWIWVQFLATFWFMVYLFSHISQIGSPMMFVYGAFIFMNVWTYTEMMDKSPLTFWYELAKNAFGAGVICYTGDWFGISQTPYAGAFYVILAYLGISNLVTYILCPVTASASIKTLSSVFETQRK